MNEHEIAVVEILRGFGWVEAGTTRGELVRVGAADAPIGNHGKAGGVLTAFGGRKRFELPGTTRRVTVGPRTVNFYRLSAMDCGPNRRLAYDFWNIKTAGLKSIRELADPAHVSRRLADPTYF